MPNVSQTMQFDVHEGQDFRHALLGVLQSSHSLVTFPSLDTGQSQHAFFNLEVRKMPSLSALFNTTIKEEGLYTIQMFSPSSLENVSGEFISDPYERLHWGLSYAGMNEAESRKTVSALKDVLEVTPEGVIGPCSAKQIEDFIVLSRQLNTISDMVQFAEDTGVEMRLTDQDLVGLDLALNSLLEENPSDAEILNIPPSKRYPTDYGPYDLF